MKGKRPSGSKQQATGREVPMLAGMAVFALLALTVIAYWGVWNHDFVNFDDTDYVVNNQGVNRGLSSEGFKWAFTHASNANWHPVTWLSHMLDVSLFGMQAKWHHLVNLGFHILNSLLLFGFLRYATGRMWPCAFAAACFALHPLHVESVAWVAERKDMLSAFFWFATMWMYAVYSRKPQAVRYAGVIALFAMGLMSKPMLVTLPVVLLLLDYWPLERPVRDRRDILRLVLEKIPLLVMAVISSVVTLNVQRNTMVALEKVDIAARAMNAVVSYGRYIKGLVWPSGLAAFYPFNTGPLIWPAVAVGILLAACTVAIWLGRRRRYLVAGWFWYLITLVPVIGLVQVGGQSHADRYTYIPLVGLFIVIGWGAAEAVGNNSSMRRAAAVAGVVLLAAMTAVTWRQVGYWKDTYTLASRAVAVTKDNCVMLSLLGACQIERDDVASAIVTLERSYAIKPGHFETVGTLGLAMLRTGRYEEAARYCEMAIAVRPQVVQNWANAGLAYGNLGQLEKARQYLAKAMALAPENEAIRQYYMMWADDGR